MAGPWGVWHGLQRLRWLPDLPESLAPNGMALGPEPSTSEFLEAFRAYAVENVPPELPEEREEVWKVLGDHGPSFGTGSRAPPGDWWCLRAGPDLMEYKGLLMMDLQCDGSSVSYFVQLVRSGTYKPEAYLEALMIIHHMLNDKDYPGTVSDPEVPEGVANSKWLRNACLEALEALAHPEDWEQGPEWQAKGSSKGKGKRSSKSTYDDESSWAGDSSSSSMASRNSRSSTRRTGYR